MKTSVIRYRVADFLKQHPPFDMLLEEELLALAGTGRVTFHESEEYLFRKGQAKHSSVRVIQQGKVEIVEERADGERIRDVLGEGDVLGLDRAESYLYAARTASDVILYSIDAGAFDELVSKNEKISRYVAAHFPAKEITWRDAEAPPASLLQRPACTPGTSIREIAGRMTGGICTVVDTEDRPVGIVTDRAIRESVADGVSLDAPCETVMDRRISSVRPGLGVAEYFIEMMRTRTPYLWVAGGILRDADLALACGRNPMFLMHATLDARNADELNYLRRCRDELLAASVASPDDVDQCAVLATLLDTAFIETVIRMAQKELDREAPPAAFCCLQFGRGGRAETLASEPPSIGIVYADSPESESVKVSEYFAALLSAVERLLGIEETGLRSQPLAGWKQYFGELIRDPLLNGIYEARSMFDFRPVFGDQVLAAQLGEFVAAELKAAEILMPVLANDTLANLPPMTFFRGLVVALDGQEQTSLDIESHALQPIEDAARVLALAAGMVSPTGTLARLQGAGEAAEEAREAFRVASFHRFRNRHKAIDPSRLSKYDQMLLKTTFQAIRRLLELTASRFGVAVQL